ncbi:MAG: hypothetical protein COW16_10450 [Sphingomonadales bacterium CG12_big_fil_rev_8_21_14_0_65_65_10]|nr:MAG: hypothetical protein COW16_10450 [Sphingomonadales bacterium CG12_big_fil_rev_8_21_14_0_65_65_10]
MPDEAEPLPIAVQPEEAIAALEAKGYEIGFDWRDVWESEHARAFTVAKAMSRDLLEDIREAVTSALEEGTTLETFIKELRPRLVRRGWWGRARMIDPADGMERVVRLGSPARLRTIYQTNLRASYMAGRWQRIQRAKRTLPYLRYVSMMDGRERPEHGAWHDTILPVDDPWWDTHFPPCGWNCRCDAQSLNERMMARRGQEVTEDPPRFPKRTYINKRTGEVTEIEQGIDPGWSYNVGKASLDGLVPPVRLSPKRDSGDESELNSVLSDDDFDRLRGFFAAFGLPTREAALEGKVFEDVAGWPLAISAGLFRTRAGTIAELSPDLLADLPDAARAIVDPDRIEWLWITGRDGRAMLVRRYLGERGSVDIGARFWRWIRGGPRARGLPAWTREEGVLNARRYIRDTDGKFARHGSSSIAAHDAIADPGRNGETTIGSARAVAGAGTEGYDVVISDQAIRHAWRRHGRGSGDPNPLSLADFDKIPDILATGTPKIRGKRGTGSGLRIEWQATVGGRAYGYVERVGRKKRQTRMVTMFRR